MLLHYFDTKFATLVPHLTKGTIWESDKRLRKFHPQESEVVSPFPTGDRKATINRHHRSKRQKNTRSTVLEQSVIKILEGLN